MTPYHNFLVEVDNNFYALPDTYMGGAERIVAEVLTDDDGDPIIPDDWCDMDYDEEEAYRMLAVRLLLDDWTSPMTVYHGDEVSIGKREWRVYTYSEADDAWDKELDHYIDDCMEIPDSIEPYFDREKWKSDARHDGRGYALASYDSEEHQQETAFGTYYIFRQN